MLYGMLRANVPFPKRDAVEYHPARSTSHPNSPEVTNTHPLQGIMSALGFEATRKPKVAPLACSIHLKQTTAPPVRWRNSELLVYNTTGNPDPQITYKGVRL